MISPMQAKALILRHIPKPKPIRVPLDQALDFILAQDIRAPFPMPFAHNSAMDGFAICSKDVQLALPLHPVSLRIQGTLKAGDAKKNRCVSGSAYRIMTGALIPKGADTVIAKEDAVLTENSLVVSDRIFPGQHVRKRGEEIQKGQKVLKKGEVINPASIGILASFGYTKIPVYKRPKISVMTTGSELLTPGEKLTSGKIYDSNSWMIRSALSRMSVEPFHVCTLRDAASTVRTSIKRVLKESDMVILSGGVSVGEYDFVKEALEKEGVETIFWKVNQKPGKPLFFGRRKEKVIFGLPGNPAAVFTCFYQYVFPAIRLWMGYKNPELKVSNVNMEDVRWLNTKRHLFLKGRISQPKAFSYQAVVLAHQGSNMLSSFAAAQGFIHVPPIGKKKAKSQKCSFHHLPYGEFV